MNLLIRVEARTARTWAMQAAHDTRTHVQVRDPRIQSFNSPEKPRYSKRGNFLYNRKLIWLTMVNRFG